jgi:hypothetical protein
MRTVSVTDLDMRVRDHVVRQLDWDPHTCGAKATRGAYSWLFGVQSQYPAAASSADTASAMHVTIGSVAASAAPRHVSAAHDEDGARCRADDMVSR